jgi:putative ABC transport system permease protein
MIQTLLQDLRYGVRALLKNRGFAAIAIFTLALGIGANSAIFSVINGVLLKPFAFPEPERLVVLWERALQRGLPRMVVSPPNFHDWRSQNQSFQAMAAYRVQDFNLTENGEPERIRGARVSGSLLAVLGVQPMLGRDFRLEEDMANAPATVILSHGFWQRRFGANPQVIGQSVTLGNERTTIIGVMPPQFDFPPPITFRGEARPLKAELWTPLRLPNDLNQRSAHNLFVLARLKPGISYAQAEADMQTIAQRLAKDYPAHNEGWDVQLVPLHQQVVGDVKTALWILPAVVACVLLIACANVANLLLVRATGRQRELAIRAALGAGRVRLIAQLLSESVLLALFSAIVGLGLAALALKLIAALAPQNIYRLDAVSLDGRVVLFTLVVSLLTALLFGFIPAWQTSQINLVTALKDGSAGASDGGGRQRLRNLLVIGEVALALLLLTGAGLLIRSFIRLQSAPTGFQAEQLTAVTINLPRTSYPDRQQRLSFADRLLPKLAALPGLQAVAFSDNLPLDTGRQGTSFFLEGQAPSAPGREQHTNVSTVSPGYFQTMGVPLLQGREFTTADNADAPGVVIISNFLAQRYFPNQNPIGKRLDMGFRSGTWLQIVGVAADERHESMQAEFRPGMYLPYAQAPSSLPLIVLLRSAIDPASLAAAVRAQVRELDPQLPVYDVKTMAQVLANASARPRFMTFLLALFAGIAVLLAVIGIYGVISYTVAQSTRELGIRVALGAQPRDILKLVVGQGFVLVLLGTALGLAGAVPLTRLLAGMLYEVTATDPLAFSSVALLLLGAALLACLIPARRATRVDPLVALKCE